MHHPSRWPRIRWYLLWLLVAAAVGLHIWLYHSVNATAGLRMRVTRAQARTIAADFLTKQDITVPPGYRTAVTFDVDGEEKNYLERTLGLAAANRVAQREGYVFYWSVRWFKPGQQEEYGVNIDPDGRVIGFSHDMPDDAPAPPSHHPAAVATAFMAERLGDAAGTYTLKLQRSTPLTRRIDYVYRWERNNPQLGQAPQRIMVTVTGDRVVMFGQYIHVPEAAQHRFDRASQQGSLLAQGASVLYIIFLVVGVVVMILGMTRRTLSWQRAALIAGIVAVISLLTELNMLPLQLAAFDTTDTIASFWTDTANSIAFNTAGTFVNLLLLVVAAEWLYRQTFPAHRPLHTWFTLDGLRSAGGRARVWLGLGLLGLHLGYVTLFYFVAERWLGGWSPASVAYDDLLGTAMPWSFALFVGVSAAVSEEFLFRVLAISWLKRWLKHDWLAILIPAMAWGFMHCNYPNQPFFIRGIELTIWGCVFGLVFVRFGPLPSLIAHAGFNALITGEWFLSSTHWSTQLSFVAVAIALLVPLALAYWPRRRQHSASASPVLLPQEAGGKDMEREGTHVVLPCAHPVDATATNAAWDAWLAQRTTQREPPLPLPEEEPPFPGIPRRAWTISLVLLVVGLALGGVWLSRKDAPSPHRWREAETRQGHLVTRAEAVRIARQAVVRAGGSLPGWKMAVAMAQQDPDDETTAYLEQYLSPDDAAMLALRVTTPPQLWVVSWQKPLSPEAWTVRLLPDGHVWDAAHRLPETTPGPAMTAEEAQATAEAALRAQGIDLRHLTLTGTNADTLKRRTQYTLTWELRGVPVGRAQCFTQVTVDAGRVDRIDRWIDIPASFVFAREQSGPRTIAATVVGLLLFIVLGILLAVNRSTLGYRTPWWWGARIVTVVIALGALLLVLARGHGWSGLDATSSPTMHLIGVAVALFGGGVFLIACGSIIGALLIPQWRVQFPELPGPRAWWRAVLRPWRHAAPWREATRGLFILLAIGAASAGVVLLAEVLLTPAPPCAATLPHWLVRLAPPSMLMMPDGTPSLTTDLAVWWPPLFAVLSALIGGYVILLYIVPLAAVGKQLFRRLWWAMLWLLGTVVLAVLSATGWREMVISGVEALVSVAGLWLAWKLVLRWNPLALPLAVTIGALITAAHELWWFQPYRPFAYLIAAALLALVAWALFSGRHHPTPPARQEAELSAPEVEPATVPALESDGWPAVPGG